MQLLRVVCHLALAPLAPHSTAQQPEEAVGAALARLSYVGPGPASESAVLAAAHGVATASVHRVVAEVARAAAVDETCVECGLAATMAAVSFGAVIVVAGDAH